MIFTIISSLFIRFISSWLAVQIFFGVFEDLCEYFG